MDNGLPEKGNLTMAAILIPFPAPPVSGRMAARKPRSLLARFLAFWAPAKQRPAPIRRRRPHGPILFSEYGHGPRR